MFKVNFLIVVSFFTFFIVPVAPVRATQEFQTCPEQELIFFSEDQQTGLPAGEVQITYRQDYKNLMEDISLAGLPLGIIFAPLECGAVYTISPGAIQVDPNSRHQFEEEIKKLFGL